jgi:hypothetical protein
MARRRKEERRAGIASRGMVRRLGRFFSGVRHRAIPERDRMPDRCHASGAAVDVCGDASAGVQRAACAADGGVVDVAPALSMSPRAPCMTAQRVARFVPYNIPWCDPTFVRTRHWSWSRARAWLRGVGMPTPPLAVHLAEAHGPAYHQRDSLRWFPFHHSG